MLSDARCFVSCRPFWDSRLDHLDCVCCASILLHVIASQCYNSKEFNSGETGPQRLEMLLVAANVLILTLACFLTVATAVEGKVKTIAIATVCTAVSRRVISLRQRLSDESDAFFCELRRVLETIPTLGVGCRVVHADHGPGLVRDWTYDDQGQRCWLVAFESGQQRQYSATSAVQKLQMVAELPAFSPEKRVRLRELSLAVEQHLGTAADSPHVVRALYSVLKAMNGDDVFDSPSDQGVPYMLVMPARLLLPLRHLRRRDADRPLQVRAFLSQPGLIPDGKSLEDPCIRARPDSGSVGRSVSQTKAASLEQPGSEIESVSFEYTSSRIGPLIHELCGDIGSLLSATGLRRFVVNASRFGNEASLIELFCMAVSLKAYINDISDTGVFAKTRKAKVYRTILLQPYLRRCAVSS